MFSITSLLFILIVSTPLDGEATELLERALSAAEAGKYSAADATYRKIVEEFPGTPEAEVAARRLEPNALLRVRELSISGKPENRIDVFVMAEGYSRDRKFQKQFDQAADGTVKYFLQAPVYKRYFDYFNFYAMNIASNEDGVDNARKQFDTALGAHESGASQGQVAVETSQVMQYLDNDARSEGLAIVIVRLGSLGTGGGGIAAIGGGPSNTIIHEWGHAFGNLLDEYTSDVGYTGPAPRGFNVTDEENEATAPWKHWLDAKTKGVGLYPGAAGRSQGAWRACATGCAMNKGPSYCLVCREAVTAHIYSLVSPIDDATPDDAPLILSRDGTIDIDVVPMSAQGPPALDVAFTIEPTQDLFSDASAPSRSGGAGNTGSSFGDDFDNPFTGDDAQSEPGGFRGGYGWGRPTRFGKKPDAPLTGEPLKAKRTKLPDKRTAHRVTLSGKSLDPGNYLVHAFVRDDTPWLIKEEWLPLLTDRRTWRVTVRE